MRLYRCIITILVLLAIVTGCKEKQNNMHTFSPTIDPTPTVAVNVDPTSAVSTDVSTDDNTETTAEPTVTPVPTETAPLHSIDPTLSDNKAEATAEPTVTPMPTETENPHDGDENANLSGESPED